MTMTEEDYERLDVQVARATITAGYLPVRMDDTGRSTIMVEGNRWEPFRPSVQWSHGGPIIEQERIATIWMSDEWAAFLMPCKRNPRGYDGHGYIDVDHYDADGRGDTPLIAAMLAYVAGKG